MEQLKRSEKLLVALCLQAFEWCHKLASYGVIVIVDGTTVVEVSFSISFRLSLFDDIHHERVMTASRQLSQVRDEG